jgi:hypothetical protein
MRRGEESGWGVRRGENGECEERREGVYKVW